MTKRPARPRTRLEVVDRGRPRTPRPFLLRVVRAALAHGGRPDLPVSLLLTDDAGIGALHAQWFGDPTPTDVISFLVDGQAELAVSVTTARRVARERGHAVRAEVALYVVHGLLHVLGHDDTTPRARARMRSAEREVLAALRLAVAPVDGGTPHRRGLGASTAHGRRERAARAGARNASARRWASRRDVDARDRRASRALVDATRARRDAMRASR